LFEVATPGVRNYFTMVQYARRCQESLRDEEIINDLYLDNLSNVPDDIFSESDTASGSDKEGVNVKVAPKEVIVAIPQG
jgi:O-methyltransferase involved in polyketide biosynthesis